MRRTGPDVFAVMALILLAMASGFTNFVIDRTPAAANIAAAIERAEQASKRAEQRLEEPARRLEQALEQLEKRIEEKVQEKTSRWSRP